MSHDIMGFSEYAKFFISLIALGNPIGVLPVFIGLTSTYDLKQRKKTNSTASIALFIILFVTLLCGNMILDFFGISIEAFRIAGGFLIASIAFNMMSGKLGEEKQNKEEKQEISIRESIAVVPLAIPLMAGPGSISITIVQSLRYPGLWNTLGMTIILAIFSAFVWLLFSCAPIITKVLRQTGINIITRIMGLILMSLGTESIITGLKPLLHGLL